MSLRYRKEFQLTKWNRFRINYDLLAQVLIAKDCVDDSKPVKKPLSIQSTVYPQ